MRGFSAVLLAFAAVSAPILARAENAPSDAAAADAAKKKGCAVPAPLPLLRKDAYPDHDFRYGRENTATESASTGAVKIEIGFSGCTDGFEHAFSFTVAHSQTPYDDRDHWLAFAAEQIKALQTWRRGREDLRDLLDFLSGAKIATTKKIDSEIRLEICRDGSPSTKDGCSKKSGGGWRFAARKIDGGAVKVYISRYLALGER